MARVQTVDGNPETEIMSASGDRAENYSGFDGTGVAGSPAADSVLSRLESTLSEWETRVSVAQRALSSRVTELKQLHNDALKAHEVTLAEMTAEHDADRVLLAEAQTTIASLHDTIAQRDATNAEAQAQIVNLKEAIVKAYAEIQGHRLRAEQEIANRQAAQEEAELARRETADAREELRGFREQLIVTRERLTETEARLAETELQLAQAQTLAQDIPSLRESLAFERAARTEAETAVTQHQETLELREAALRTTEDQLAAMKESIVNAYAETQEQRLRVEQEISNRQTLQDEIEEARRETTEAREELRRLRDQLALTRELLEETKNQLANKEQQLLEALASSQEIEELRQALEEEKTTVARFNDSLRAQEEEKAALAQQLSTLHSEHDKLDHESSQLRIETEALRQLSTGMVVSATSPLSGPAYSIQAYDTDGRRKRIGEIMIEMGLISRSQLEEALRAQDSRPQRRLGAIFVEMGFAEEEIIARVIARQLDLSFVRITPESVEPQAVTVLSREMAERRNCMPLSRDANRLILAMANPLDLVALDEVEGATGLRVDPVMATPTDIAEAIARHYNTQE